MNIHTDALFNTVIHHICEVVPSVLASISLDPELLHLQMEDIKKYIQDATSNYLVRTPISEIYIIYIADDTIKNTKAFLQSYHSYSEFQATQDYLTPYLRS